MGYYHELFNSMCAGSYVMKDTSTTELGTTGGGGEGPIQKRLARSCMNLTQFLQVGSCTHLPYRTLQD